MDRDINPFAPGAGYQPPALVGRAILIGSVAVAIERTRKGLQAKSLLLVGLRGVGKTVLLDHLRENATNTGAETLRIEASEKKSLPATLTPAAAHCMLL